MILATLLMAASAQADRSTLVHALSVRPQSVEVGEPFVLTVAVGHGLDELVPPLDVSLFETDFSWVLFGHERSTAVPDERDLDRRWTRFELELASLEPGERTLPAELILLAGKTLDQPPPGVPGHLHSVPLVQVGGLLGEAEDEPRPLRGIEQAAAGLIDGEDEGGLPDWVKLVVAGVVGALVASGWGILKKRKGQAGFTAVASPSASFDSLQSELRGAREREGHYELTHLVRVSLDRSLGRDRSGLTDDQWLLAVRGETELPAYLREGLEEFLARCAAVKYAGTTPSSFALDENWSKGRELLTQIEEGRWSA